MRLYPCETLEKSMVVFCKNATEARIFLSLGLREYEFASWVGGSKKIK